MQEKLEALEKQREEMQAVLAKLRKQLEEKNKEAVKNKDLKPLPVL